MFIREILQVNEVFVISMLYVCIVNKIDIEVWLF